MITVDNYAVQSCCMAYGGNSFPGPMKRVLETYLSILKAQYPEIAAASDLLTASKNWFECADEHNVECHCGRDGMLAAIAKAEKGE